REDEPKNKPPGSNTKYIAFGIVLVLAVVSFFVFQNLMKPSETIELTTVSMISASQASASLTASGYVVAQRKAALASKATGRLIYLNVEEGDKVLKHDVIGRIESADVEAALAQAKATLELYKADLYDAKQSLERVKTMVERSLVAQADLDAAQARYGRVLASISAAEAAVKAAEVQVENTFIRAPFAGTVLTKNADVGEVVAPFGAGASSKVAVVTIADMNSLEVEADVSESNIEKIKSNQPCDIVLDAYPEKRYSGYVSKIVPTADRAKATVMTKVRFNDKDDRVLPEMSAKVYFLSKAIETTTNSKPKIVVSQSAIVNRGGNTIAFLYRDETVKEVNVELGEILGNNVEVLRGLTPGDKVVASPSTALQSGAKVKIKE
ncbi:MAG: efflux RND transporter periplasmic adaptor subunit, partial [Bacteroidetes bacterium]